MKLSGKVFAEFTLEQERIAEHQPRAVLPGEGEEWRFNSPRQTAVTEPERGKV